MTRPILPPRGIEIPTNMLFDTTLRNAIKITWAQLRALSWGQTETPSFSAQQFLELTGTKPGTLYEHMRILRDRHALQWRSGTAATFIVSFTAPDADQPAPTDAQILKIQNSENPEVPNKALDIANDRSETKERAHSENSESENSETRKPAKKPTKPSAVPPAVTIYREVSQRFPKRSLYDLITEAVGDQIDRLDLWKKVVTAYIGMGWNPINILGMLEYFKRGEIPAPKASSHGKTGNTTTHQGSDRQTNRSKSSGGDEGHAGGADGSHAARTRTLVETIQRRAAARAGQSMPVLPETTPAEPGDV